MPRNKIDRCRSFVFTLNNYEISDISSIKTLSEVYCFQAEKGENGTPHLQGCIRFPNQKVFSEVSKLLPRAHIEKCKSWKDSVVYCQKPEGRIDGPWCKGVKKIIKIKDPLEKVQEWQQDILNYISGEVNPREIYWVIDYEGNKGKTQLAKHICMNYDAIVLGGRACDMKYGVSAYIEKNGSIDVIILDLPRSLEDFVSYSGIEAVKNGIFFNSKYESGMCMYNTPHVIVLSNFDPDIEKLSKDRWKIVRI